MAKRLRSSQFAIDEQLPVVHDRLHMLVHLTRMLADVASQVQRIHLTCLRAQVLAPLDNPETVLTTWSHGSVHAQMQRTEAQRAKSVAACIAREQGPWLHRLNWPRMHAARMVRIRCVFMEHASRLKDNSTQRAGPCRQMQAPGPKHTRLARLTRPGLLPGCIASSLRLTTHWILTGLCVYPFFRQRDLCAMTALSRVLENA